MLIPIVLAFTCALIAGIILLISRNKPEPNPIPTTQKSEETQNILNMVKEARAKIYSPECWDQHTLYAFLSSDVAQETKDHLKTCKSCRCMVLATYPDRQKLNEMLNAEVYTILKIHEENIG